MCGKVVPIRSRKLPIRFSCGLPDTGKNENMQADVQSIQSTHHIYCPLCHSPLVYRTGDNAIGISDGTSASDVFCSVCGYTGPVVSRQHAGQAPRRPPRSSVWIDPAVSTYLQGESVEQLEQSS